MTNNNPEHFIEIKNLEVYAYHGVFPKEQKNGQRFFLSARLYFPMEKAMEADSLDDSVDYGAVCALINSLMTKKNFQLIEAAADYVAKELLLAFPKLHRTDLTLSKPDAPVPFPFENISVNITKCRHTAYIGLGSNIGDKKQYLDNAVAELNDNPYCHVRKVSDYIVTKPYGYAEQEDFLNAALELETLLSPNELLMLTNTIEQKAGRTRDIHWGPRTLDLDILFYDDMVTEEKTLILPHPEIEKRDFVLTPLKQIAPYKLHPILNRRITDITSQ